MSLDRLDRQLIASLKLDGRMSYAELAGRLGVSEGTARNRLARLIESGTVRVLPIVDQTRLGYRLNAWIGVRCRPGQFRRVAEELAGFHAVRYVGACTGAYDVIVEAVFLSQAEMLRFLESELPTVEGITSTETSLVLEMSKLGYEWELREEDARSQHSAEKTRGG
ncbi:MAG TPA: Lrp/AsnC family transcriptional regulator [Solirubrobacterales bacterium]|jgi:Lrp/AsnC family transcriptional regulator for asnA, asnC and gidA|nr:Lrp/AsnC family transcriptional regulator [Gaiellales bacterium]HYY73492.1 Lrp/AsnC family transcriptional regulator [Solirubrobacterales bacterium]